MSKDMDIDMGEQPKEIKETKKKRDKTEGKKRKREELPQQEPEKVANDPALNKKSRTKEERKNNLSPFNSAAEAPPNPVWPGTPAKYKVPQANETGAVDDPPPNKRRKADSKPKDRVAYTIISESEALLVLNTPEKLGERLPHAEETLFDTPPNLEKNLQKKKHRHKKASNSISKTRSFSSAEIPERSQHLEGLAVLEKAAVDSVQTKKSSRSKKDRYNECISSSTQSPSASKQPQEDEALQEIEEVIASSLTKRTQLEQKEKIRSSISEPSLSLDTSDGSPFHIRTFSLYLALSPISQLHPLKSLCAENLSPLLLTYYPPFNGVVLSYSNPCLTQEPGEEVEGRVLAQSIDEYAAPFVWVTADFLIFRPQEGGWIEGWVNLQNEDHLGLVCWNLFSASVERERVSSEWRWIPAKNSTKKRKFKVNGVTEDDERRMVEKEETEGPNYEDAEAHGYYEDGNGDKVEGNVRFRVLDIETSMSTSREKNFLSIEGSMLTDEEERELEQQRAYHRVNGVTKSRESTGRALANSVSKSTLTYSTGHRGEDGNPVDKGEKGKGKRK